MRFLTGFTLALCILAVSAWGGETVRHAGLVAAAAVCERPYAPSSPWNTPIGAYPAYHPQSDLHVGALQGVLSSDPKQYTYPVYAVDKDTPRWPVTLRGWYSTVGSDGRVLQNQRGGVAHLPIPEGAQSAAGSDAQIILVDYETGDEWGSSNLKRTSDGSYVAWNAYHYNIRWSAVSPRDSDGRPFFARGAGVPYLAGLVRPCEIARNRIDHALAFAYDSPTADYLYPATKSDGKGADPGDMPEGTRLQLDPALSDAQIGAWGCHGPCRTIARALQEFGMYVIDNSGREKVMLEYEGTARWNGLVSSTTVRPIPLNAFKVVLDAKPKLKALAGVARPGKTVRLRYRVYDGGGETREEGTVYRNGRAVAHLMGALHVAEKGVAYGFSWRAPRVLEGKLRFCVRAWDPAGNETGPRCAPLKIASTS